MKLRMFTGGEECRQKQSKVFSPGDHVHVCTRKEHSWTAWHVCDCGIIW